MGKGLTRTTNQVWNYFFKGVICTIAIVVFFPILCITVCTTSIFVAIATPIWIPFSIFLLHLYMMFLYDLDGPCESRNRYCIFLEAFVWNIIIKGCVQPIIAFAIGILICPFAAFMVFIFGIIRYWTQLFWDHFTYHLFIKKFARVPSSNSFMVKRISGPGLTQNYYFLIRLEQALAAFEAKMELEELKAYQLSIKKYIFQPQDDLRHFVDACFGSFSAQLNMKSDLYKLLERESQDFMHLLNEKLERRYRDLDIGLSTSSKRRIKLYPKDLKMAIEQGKQLLTIFYPEHVIKRLYTSEEEFWDSKVF